jgi:hypothetical protein
MKYVKENILCLEEVDAVDAGLSIAAIRKAKQRNSPSWKFHEHPDDKRKILFEYEKLKDSDKNKVIARFGNPYEYIVNLPIRNLVKWDDKAEEFYLAYRYDEGKPLPIEHVKKYTLAASWLNMFKKVTEDKKVIKDLLKLTIDQFYTHAIEIIIQDKIDLPTSYRRLVVNQDSALKKYINDGYASLINWQFGNKKAAKIKDELSESVLLEMIADPNQFDDVYIAVQYNRWAKQNNYKTIDPATVGNHRRKKESLIMMEREGNSALNEKYLKQAKGFRPTAPLLLVEHDDNHLDLLFIDHNDDDNSSKYFHKYKAIVVMDSFNDYPLGYAYAEKLSTELVQAAYLNAMYHIRSITGAWYLPHETKSDRWAIKTLEPFYHTLGKYFKTPVGSKHRGYIEPFFGSPHWKRCLKMGANNYSGNNMTAKHRGVNTEALDRARKDRPTIGNEAIEQIENFFYRLRHLPQTTTGISKHQQWIEAWNNVPAENKRQITDEQFLLKLGVVHNNQGKGIRITNRGVEPQICGVRRSYDLATQSLMEFIGKSVSVVYDPYDMSRVLVTDFDKVRLMGYDAKMNSRALEDADVDSRTYLNAVLTEKREDVNYIASKSERRKDVLESAGVDAETLLQAGVMTKEIRQRAEVRVLAQNSAMKSEDWHEQI